MTGKQFIEAKRLAGPFGQVTLYLNSGVMPFKAKKAEIVTEGLLQIDTPADGDVFLDLASVSAVRFN